MKFDLSKYGIIGQSEAMQAMAKWVNHAAPYWDTVLITGERGTGKELLAKAIHRLGPTRGAEPVTVDCAALHSSTVEAALFGHERGAFTGAVHKKIGFLESAQDGSIFFDEIGTLPLDIQCRFLRFLEERTVTRIGSLNPVHIKTRVIAATNRNLEEEVSRGAFLPDLYDRLCVLPIHTPPLRERNGDLQILMEHILGNEFYQRIQPEALDFLQTYPFPGNVRELRNLCRRLVIFHSQGEIDETAIRKNLGYPDTIPMEMIPVR